METQNLLPNLEYLKTYGVYSPEESSFLDKVIQDLKNVGTFVSSIFKKTSTLTIEPHKEDFTVNKTHLRRDFFKEVTEKEKKAGNPTFWIDDWMWESSTFKKQTFKGFVNPVITTVYRFQKNLKLPQIIEESKNMKIFKVYSYVEALCIAKALLLSNELDQRGTEVLVYFQIPGNTTLFHFRCLRSPNGKLGLSGDMVDVDAEFVAGGGACLSNVPSVN